MGWLCYCYGDVWKEVDRIAMVYYFSIEKNIASQSSCKDAVLFLIISKIIAEENTP